MVKESIQEVEIFIVEIEKGGVDGEVENESELPTKLVGLR